MKGYLDAKELESYKKEDLQELAKQLGVDAEGTKKEIAARCAAVEVDIPDDNELTEEDKKAAAEAAAEAAAKAEEEKAAAEAAAKAEEEKKVARLVKVKVKRRFRDMELNQIKDAGDAYTVSRERAAVAIKRKAGFMNMTITEFIEAAAHNKIIQLVVLAIVCDTVFGVLRAIKEKKFNSCAGIDGAIRKVGMLISLVFMLAIDVLIKINLIGFIPEQARTYLGLDTVGVAEFFALLYIAYEVVSIFKNMALCGLPVKKVWEKVREFLAKYTDELPDTDELDGDSTTGNVEEHRTQER